MATSNTFEIYRKIKEVFDTQDKPVYFLNLDEKTPTPKTFPSFIAYFSFISYEEYGEGCNKKTLEMRILSFDVISDNLFSTIIDKAEDLTNELINLFENGKDDRFYDLCIGYEVSEENPPSMIQENIICIGRAYTFTFLENNKINLGYLA